jgi:hypothetical protein
MTAPVQPRQIDDVAGDSMKVVPKRWGVHRDSVTFQPVTKEL